MLLEPAEVRLQCAVRVAVRFRRPWLLTFANPSAMGSEQG